MYLVAIAWLYIVGTASMTAETFAGGATAFALIGVAPVSLVVVLDAMRARRLRVEHSRRRGAAADPNDGPT